MSKVKLILASQSKARRRLLKRLGLSFIVRPAHIDEEAVAKKIHNPRALVRTLAIMKAEAVALENPNAIVIGSDQVLVCGGRVFGKPHTEAKAQAQLKAFSGRSISLLTAVCVVSLNGKKTFVHETRMKFRKLSAQEIATYVRMDQPIDCAGSFKFESYGIGLFDSVKTDDPTAIEGLPLIHLGRIIRTIAVS